MKKAIPVLFLDNSFTFGGAIISLRYLVQALSKDEFDSIVISGQPKEYMANNFDCIWYHYIPKLPWVNNRIYCKIEELPIFQSCFLRKMLNISRFLFWLLFITFPEAVRLYQIGHRHGVGVVHLNNGFSTQISGIIAAKLLRVPCVGHLRGFAEVDRLTKFYASLVDHHAAISVSVQDNLEQLDVCDDRITLVHDAINLDDFRMCHSPFGTRDQLGLKPGQPIFGIFGRVVDWKGIREFIIASRQVINKIHNACGLVVGDSSDGDESYFRAMQKLVADLDLTGKVLFTGYREDVPALMGSMDVIVHASTIPEPFGMVIIEGMAMGKPVIATRAGGPIDIVTDGESGILVEPGNSEEMAQAIIHLLQDPKNAKEMGQKGRQRVEELFNNKRYAEQVEGVYNKLLS